MGPRVATWRNGAFGGPQLVRTIRLYTGDLPAPTGDYSLDQNARSLFCRSVAQMDQRVVVLSFWCLKPNGVHRTFFFPDSDQDWTSLVVDFPTSPNDAETGE